MRRLRTETERDRYGLFTVVGIWEGDRRVALTTVAPGQERAAADSLKRRIRREPEPRPTQEDPS